ncbi:mCG1028437, isoform CRA_a [Mus musculus]|nr:mCG1028437, isoform CRA_a [Mus musculus]
MPSRMAGGPQRYRSLLTGAFQDSLPNPQPCDVMGAEDMGSKLSLPGGSSTVQCPSMEEIHTAYKQRNLSRARDLLRGVCEESESSQEKGLQACPSLPGLRCWG